MTAIRLARSTDEHAIVAGWLAAEWPGAVMGTTGTRWIAHRDGQPVGMVGIAEEADPFAPGTLPCPVELRVVPAWRGRGVGRALCRHVVARARARGLPALWLFTRDRQAWFRAQGWGEVTQAALRTRRGLEWATVMRLALASDKPDIDIDDDIDPRTHPAP